MFEIEESAIGRIVVAPSLPAHKALFYTTIDFQGRLDHGTVQKLLALIHDRFGIEAALSTCTQVHGATVTRAKPSSAGSWKECDSCDALWTDARGNALAIKVADCLPVTIIDDRHDVIANVHSGWRGAALGITGATLDALVRDTTFDPAASSAYLGPTIRACCFEVGEEVVEQLSARYENVERFVDRTHAKPHVDVARLTADLLRRRGFAEARIFDSGLCTRCNGSIFHSFRRDRSGGGRNLAIAAQ